MSNDSLGANSTSTHSLGRMSPSPQRPAGYTRPPSTGSGFGGFDEDHGEAAFISGRLYFFQTPFRILDICHRSMSINGIPRTEVAHAEWS